MNHKLRIIMKLFKKIMMKRMKNNSATNNQEELNIHQNNEINLKSFAHSGGPSESCCLDGDIVFLAVGPGPGSGPGPRGGGQYG